MNNCTAGHRKRLKEKYNRFGHDYLFDYEKIELLLTYAVPRVDVKPLAKDLLEELTSLCTMQTYSGRRMLEYRTLLRHLLLEAY